MSEIVVANVFFSSDKQTGLVGGTPNTFSIIAGNTTSLIANSAGITLNNVSFSSNSSVSVGNSSVNSTINSTTISVGSNVAVNSSTIFVGNSSVNSTITAASIVLGNTIVNNSIISVNDLRINTINAISNSLITIPTGTKLYAPGSIVQVVQTIKKDTWASAGTGGTTFYAVTGLTANITPISTNSKILVNVCVHVSSGYWEVQGRLTRGNTGISDTYGNVRGSRTQCSFVFNIYEGGGTGYGWLPVHYMYLDSPANTSTLTYGLHLNPYNGYYVAVNYNVYSDADFADYFGSPSSTITLMEIAQ